jgi:hypothetical protein
MQRTARLRTALTLLCGLSTLVVAGAGHADDTIDVPVELQVDLLGRVAPYERGLARASGELRVLVVSRRGHAVSTRTAAQLVSVLRRTGTMLERPMRIDELAFESWPAVLAVATSRGISVVYLTPGLEEGLSAMSETFAGHRILTVSTVGSYVPRGAVLGFEIVSSRPRIVVNLAQARRQQLDFSAQLLRLARVLQ